MPEHLFKQKPKMPELMNICCVFENAPPDRDGAIESLFLAGRHWVGRPMSLMMLDVHSGAMRQESWPPAEALADRELGERLFFVYSQPPGNREGNRCVSIQEAGGRAVYTFSLPVHGLVGQLAAEFERQLVDLHRCVQSIGECFMFVGPELEVDASRSVVDTVRLENCPGSLTYWIVAPSAAHPGSELIRRPDTADPFGVLS